MAMAKTSRLLLDTHIFLWWLNNDRRLSTRLGRLLADPSIIVFISVASVWEMVIKKSIGKLRYPPNLSQAIRASGFEVLPIELEHVLELRKLPGHHRDPFDRILIAQARSGRLSLVTADPKMSRYTVKITKA